MFTAQVIKTAVPLFTAFILLGCANLKEVGDFAVDSGKMIRKWETLGYSFKKACHEKCQLDQFERQQLPETECTCTGEKTADSIFLSLYNVVKDYFDGLAKLSAKKLTQYTMEPVSKALKTGSFGDLIIQDSHVDAYAKITGILLRSLTDGYRKRKLTALITEANQPLATLLSGMETILISGLSKRLATQQERLMSFYSDLLNENTGSSYEKKKIIEEYNKAQDEWKTRKNQMENFCRGLRSVSMGHQELYTNRNNLKEKDFHELLIQFIKDIRKIESEFNSIKNSP